MVINRVLIRADSSSQLGAGHVMRSVALAQYLSHQNIQVKFLTFTKSKDLSEYLKKQKFEIEFVLKPTKNVNESREIIVRQLKTGFDWLILDDYELGEADHLLFRTHAKLLVISDVSPYTKQADIVMNHALTDSNEKSNKPLYLFGTQYALIRQELIHSNKREKKSNQNILITLGGSPFPELLNQILSAINLISDRILHVKVLSNLMGQRIARYKISGRHKIEYSSPSFDMQNLLNWADVSISAAGGTSWELCYFGVTGIIGIVADNQIQIAKNLNEHGIFKSVGWYKDCPPDRLAGELNQLLNNPDLLFQMRTKAKQLIDGKGPERIFKAMQGI